MLEQIGILAGLQPAQMDLHTTCGGAPSYVVSGFSAWDLRQMQQAESLRYPSPGHRPGLKSPAPQGRQAEGLQDTRYF